MELEKKNIDFFPNLSYKDLLTNPILDIAARFWDDERYNASKIVYRSFRIIDDLVDNQKSVDYKISDIEKQQLKIKIKNWIGAIKDSKPIDPLQKELIKTIEKFKIPIWPFQKFSESMIYDIQNRGFKTFQNFLEYVEGAAIAPASIYMHLCGLKKK